MLPVRGFTSTHLLTNYNKPINQPGNPSAKSVGQRAAREGKGFPTERTTELPTRHAANSRTLPTDLAAVTNSCQASPRSTSTKRSNAHALELEAVRERGPVGGGARERAAEHFVAGAVARPARRRVGLEERGE